MRRPCYILVVVLALLPGCSSDLPEPGETKDEKEIPFQREGQVTFYRDGQKAISIAVEIAETDSARQRGLMQRTSLPDSSGMLFLFPTAEKSGFWMANTPLSLDIFFVSPDSQIVDIAKYTKPLSAQNIPSAAPYRYVVEVPAGFADTHGLVEGNRVNWTRR